VNSRFEVSRALGGYRGSWFVVWPATALAAGWIFLEVTRLSREDRWEPIVFLVFWVAFLAAVCFVPQTVISKLGRRSPRSVFPITAAHPRFGTARMGQAEAPAKTWST
jgi:hypothetical protein